MIARELIYLKPRHVIGTRLGCSWSAGGAVLGNLATLQDHDFVGMLDDRAPMGNSDRGSHIPRDHVRSAP